MIVCNDGTGKTPRPNQIDYINYLSSIFKKYRYHVLVASPGSGKSFIARCINRSIESSTIITPSNQLVQQYVETYPNLVPVMGVDNYPSENEYRAARIRAQQNPAIFNPVSFYYYYLNKPQDKPNCVIIDEAHSLASLLTTVVSQNFPCTYWGIPDDMDDAGFLDWITKRCEKLEKVKYHPKFHKQFEKLWLLKEYVTSNIKNIQFNYQDITNPKTRQKERNFCIAPLTFPKELLDIVFGETCKLVFMSGTFNKMHLKELGIQEYSFKEYAHPAPIENRTIQVKQVDRDNLMAQAAMINKIRGLCKNPNTVVHIPYSLQAKFKALIPDAITHTKETKDLALGKFKRKGGILLASGMAEGIDLPDDQCRLIIIPKLLYPNLGNDAVKKRMLFPDGQTWYLNTTITTTIQQIYRGVRGKDDWCTIVILDPTFERTINRIKGHISKDLLRSIKW